MVDDGQIMNPLNKLFFRLSETTHEQTNWTLREYLRKNMQLNQHANFGTSPLSSLVQQSLSNPN